MPRVCELLIYLPRAILDHVPPIFGFKSFAEVASNYGGEKSFRKAMERLEKHSRASGRLVFASRNRESGSCAQHDRSELRGRD